MAMVSVSGLQSPDSSTYDAAEDLTLFVLVSEFSAFVCGETASHYQCQRMELPWIRKQTVHENETRHVDYCQ